MIAPSREPMQPALLVTSEVACEVLSLSIATLRRITAPNGDLPAVRIGNGKRRLLRYRICDLESWIDANCTDRRHGGEALEQDCGDFVACSGLETPNHGET